MNPMGAHVSTAPPTSPAKTSPAKAAPIWGFLFAFAAVGVGMITFLIAGFEGHSAGWELMALPTLATFGAALVGFVGSMIGIFANKAYVGSVVMLAMSGFAGLLALVGFVLGA